MKLVEQIETWVIYVLIVLLLTSIVFGTVELARTLFATLMTPPLLLIEPEALFHGFGLFLIVIIGLELLKVLKLHLSAHTLKPEVVIAVAMIAVCNKIVTLDVKGQPSTLMLGLAALVLALAGGYFVFVRVRGAS